MEHCRTSCTTATCLQLSRRPPTCDLHLSSLPPPLLIQVCRSVPHLHQHQCDMIVVVIDARGSSRRTAITRWLGREPCLAAPAAPGGGGSQSMQGAAKEWKWKKALRETQTLRAGCSKAGPKIYAPPQTPFPGARDGQNLISWRWSLSLPTNPVWWGSMHAISRPTNTRHPPARPPVANSPTDRTDNNTLRR